jgi:hypothetical protein
VLWMLAFSYVRKNHKFDSFSIDPTRRGVIYADAPLSYEGVYGPKMSGRHCRRRHPRRWGVVVYDNMYLDPTHQRVLSRLHDNVYLDTTPTYAFVCTR